MPFDSLPVSVPLTEQDQKAWEIIHRAIGLLDAPGGGWVQGAYERTTNDAAAPKYCLLGALNVAANLHPNYGSSNNFAGPIVSWNDRNNRTKLGVLRVIKHAEFAILSGATPRGIAGKIVARVRSTVG